MSGDKRYFENVSMDQLARFFRELADRLAGAGADEADPRAETPGAPDPGEFNKLKISVKRDLGGYTLKWKSKAFVQETVVEGGSPPVPESPENIKYKSLKKQMKKSFKTITEGLMADVMPGEAVVTAFVQDSKLMMGFPDKGADYYDDYDKALGEFTKAFEAKDLEACKAVGIALNQLKKDCHSRYK